MPNIMRNVRTLTPRSLSNAIYGMATLGVTPSGRRADIFGAVIVGQLKFMNGQQLGVLSIGLPEFKNFTMARRLSIAMAASRQVADLAKSETLGAADVCLQSSKCCRKL
jgi:hypothetical protein